MHLANALENSINNQRPGEEPKLDLDYPTELRIIEQLDTFRDLVQNSARTKSSATQFIRRPAAAPAPGPKLNPQIAAETSPNGFWSRFRGLLAT